MTVATLSLAETHWLDIDYIADYTLDITGPWPTLTVTHFQSIGPNQYHRERLTTVIKGSDVYPAMDKLADRGLGRPASGAR
ncbi:MAG: hypothetical protein JWR77_2351 [Rhizorhabdus sp.]|nr:hypothetical protein [Rhizorhabdus sp.]